MSAGSWVMTDEGRTKLTKGEWIFGTDTFNIALFLSTSNLGAASTTYAGLNNEHANANGYTTGGVVVTTTIGGTTTVTVTFTGSALWTAAGGSIVAKYAVLYEVGGRVVAYCTLDAGGADVTVTTGNTLTIVANASGVSTLA